MRSIQTNSNLAKLFLLLTFQLCISLVHAKGEDPILYGINYLSPKANSIEINVNTNFIINFMHPVRDLEDYSAELEIKALGSAIEYTVIKQDDPKKIILKPKKALPVNAVVEVKINTHNLQDVAIGEGIYEYSFTTQKQANSGSLLNEDWLRKKLEEGNGTAVKTAGIGSAIINDLANRIPFNMSVSAKNENDYFFTASMLSQNNDDRLMIIDGKGQLVYDKITPYNSLDFKMHADTTFSYAILAINADDYGFVVMDRNFMDIDTIKAGNGYVTDIHELVKDHKTGNYFLLAQRIVTVNLFEILGYGSTQAKILDLIVQEINSKGDVVFEWKCLDYLPITDRHGVNLSSTEVIDYVHCNGIMLDSDSTLLLSSRHLREVTRINRKTGAILWRLGTHASSMKFSFPNDIDGFTYLHHAQKLANGNILLFDNGNFKTGSRYSRAVEYAIDETLMVATKVWEYRHDPDVTTNFMGSVQRLGNGNTVIGWGSGSPSFTEVDSSGKIIYEGSLPDGVLNYRTFKYQIPDLIKVHQPKLNLPSNFEVCKMRDADFTNKVYHLVAPFIDASVSENYRLFQLEKGAINLILSDSSNNFYGYYNQALNFKNIGLVQTDTTICFAKAIVPLKVADACVNSSYKWSTNETSKEINFKTKPNLNKVWVSMKNGEMEQTDTVVLSVSPVEEFDIIGELNPMKAYQIIPYSIPYYKGVTYEWKAINGNVVAGYETNAIQVMWGNKQNGYLQGTITDMYGCVISSPWDTVNFTTQSNSIEELLSVGEAKIYPSPFGNVLQLEGEKPFVYKVYSLQGNLITEENQVQLGLHKINTEEWASGIYVVELTIESNRFRIKVCKE
jgi:hypothetical protein